MPRDPSKKPIAVFNAGPITPDAGPFYEACAGDNDVLFRNACGLDPDQVVKIEVQKNDVRLPSPEDISGVIVSGSVSMVTDLEPWAERAVAWVRANRDCVPMLGVCYGHQMLSHALGGTVGWMPKPEYGTIEIDAAPDAKADPLTKGLPDRFLVQSAHSQTVFKLPPGAKLLARGATGVQAARLSERTWGLQFHPEYDARVSRALMKTVRDYLTGKGLDADKALASVRETPLALEVLRRFARVCGFAERAVAAE